MLKMILKRMFKKEIREAIKEGYEQSMDKYRQQNRREINQEMYMVATKLIREHLQDASIVGEVVDQINKLQLKR